MKKFKSFFKGTTITVWITRRLAIVLLVIVFALIAYMFYCFSIGQLDRALTIGLCLCVVTFSIKTLQF